MDGANVRDQFGKMFWMIGAGCLFLAGVAMVLGIGLWKLLNWARMLQIVFLFLFLSFQMLATMGAMQHFNTGRVLWRVFIVAIEAWVLIYLFKTPVKQAFGKTVEQPRSA